METDFHVINEETSLVGEITSNSTNVVSSLYEISRGEYMFNKQWHLIVPLTFPYHLYVIKLIVSF